MVKSNLLKFRAWDKTDNKMISWNRLLNGHNLRNVFMRPEMCGLILMQSTGIKDIHGAEIFEGDIAKLEVDNELVPNLLLNDYDYIEGYTQLGVVSYKGASFIYATQRTLEGREENHEEPVDWLNNLEVIGNIHENPELLEEK